MIKAEKRVAFVTVEKHGTSSEAPGKAIGLFPPAVIKLAREFLPVPRTGNKFQCSFLPRFHHDGFDKKPIRAGFILARYTVTVAVKSIPEPCCSLWPRSPCFRKVRGVVAWLEAHRVFRHHEVDHELSAAVVVASGD